MTSLRASLAAYKDRSESWATEELAVLIQNIVNEELRGKSQEPRGKDEIRLSQTKL